MSKMSKWIRDNILNIARVFGVILMISILLFAGWLLLKVNYREYMRAEAVMEQNPGCEFLGYTSSRLVAFFECNGNILLKKVNR